jgi:GTP:adenosylcobinamide-phosphate guanylyltransferase
MDAVITAGGIPEPDDPLYPYTQGKPKALLELAGRPLIQWVLDAVSASDLVQNIVVVGLSSEDNLTSDRPLNFVPNQGDMLQNIRAGTQKAVALNEEATYVLTVSSDIPGITREMVDWTITSALETDHDLYYNVITREVMEGRYPGSNRSYVRLKDYELCGGDMNVFRASLVTTRKELWERIIASRKNPLKQVALIGYGSLVLLLLGRLTLESGIKRASKGLGIRGRALICPYAEIGMDVDKPYQLEILAEDLSKKTLP